MVIYFHSIDNTRGPSPCSGGMVFGMSVFCLGAGLESPIAERMLFINVAGWPFCAQYLEDKVQSCSFRPCAAEEWQATGAQIKASN